MNATPSFFPPQAYIIGAAKAATTSLAALLSQHPELTLSDPKEPDFFTNEWKRGLDWYRGCFARHDTLLLDASTSYTMAHVFDSSRLAKDDARGIDVPRRIRDLRPDAKFIYIVRDPAARTFSAYWHDVREGRESRPLRQVIAEDVSYLNPSFYYGQISRYLAYFPLDRFLFLRFEEFVRDPLFETNRCAEFLGLRPFTFDAESARNESFLYNRLGRAVWNSMGRERLQKIAVTLRSFLPDNHRRALKSLISHPVPRLTSEERNWLLPFFEKDMEAFDSLMASCSVPKAVGYHDNVA